MKLFRICLQSFVVIGIAAGLSAARQSGEAELVQSWYRKYLKRNADPPSLRMFASQLRRGVPQVEIQGTILGSDEYFARYGNRPDQFIGGLYADALGRQAGDPEVRVWLQRLQEVNGDRNELAKRFLRSAENEQVTGGLRPIDTVRLWYQKYLGRQVDPSGVNRYVGLLRQGASPLDCQAEVLGSDEYFNRQGGTLEGFIVGLYRDVLGRTPTHADLRNWRNTLNRLGGNRQTLARQFLGQAGTQIDIGTPPMPPPNTAPGGAGDLLSQIAQRADQFSSMIQAEIPGTPQARQCILRAQALQTAALNLQNQVAANAPQNILVSSVSSLDRAYRALRERLARPPGTAPNSEQIADYIGQLIANWKSGPAFAGGQPAFPPPAAPPNVGYDQGVLLNLMNSMLANASQLLRSMSGQTFLFQGMRRDVEGYARQLDSLREQVQRGEPLAAVQSTYQGLQRLSNTITERMRHPAVPTYWQQLWVNVGAGQTQLGVGLQIAAAAAPAQPAGSPPPPPIPPANLVITANLIGSVDSLVGEIDAYLASIAPQLTFHPEYVPLQAQLNAMRAAILEMRQSFAVGSAPAVYRGQFAEAQSAFQQLTNLFNAISASNPTTVPPALDQLNAAFNEVAKAMPR